ncbi:MAG TPA: DUF192 domain-containing protein [Steroidobacteraceae bacterium]|nr:DUF192 domain-containing protein [Steroidobacteraceae bacterium]
MSRANGRAVRVINETRGSELGDRVAVARSFWSRGRGLMFRQFLAPGSGLVIEPCSSIHTMWMRFPLDVLYLSREHEVLRADSAMPPWRIGPLRTRSRYVVELPAGAIRASGTQPGDRLRLVAE